MLPPKGRADPLVSCIFTSHLCAPAGLSVDYFTLSFKPENSNFRHGLRLNLYYFTGLTHCHFTELTTQLTPDQKQGHACLKYTARKHGYHTLSPHVPRTFHTVQTRLCHTHRHPHTQLTQVVLAQRPQGTR